jgi:hypothetical protein
MMVRHFLVFFRLGSTLRAYSLARTVATHDVFDSVDASRIRACADIFYCQKKYSLINENSISKHEEF